MNLELQLAQAYARNDAFAAQLGGEHYASDHPEIQP